MRIAWIMGWATPRAWFAEQVKAVFPSDEHVLFEAAAETWERLEKCDRFDCLAGYSLGSHLLLKDSERASRLAPRVVLFAPIFAFTREAGHGGKIARAQVRYLAKWLRHDLPAALADFSERADLALPENRANEMSLPQLGWGLERLEKSQVAPPAPEGWEVYCGTGDKLLDLVGLRKLDPAIRAVEGGTHHPRELFEAWARSRSLTADARIGVSVAARSGDGADFKVSRKPG